MVGVMDLHTKCLTIKQINYESTTRHPTTPHQILVAYQVNGNFRNIRKYKGIYVSLNSINIQRQISKTPHKSPKALFTQKRSQS